MSLHLSILRRSDVERPKTINKRARTSSTELLDEPDEDPVMLHQQQAPPINWQELIINTNNGSIQPLKEQLEKELLKSASFSSAESTTLSEDEMCSLNSLIEQSDGFESGFETFDDFLNFSASNLEEEEGTTVGEVKTKSKSKLKRKLKKLKAKLKTSCHVKQLKRIRKNSGAILRAVTNATALVFRGALFLTMNVLIVLTVILSLAII